MDVADGPHLVEVVAALKEITARLSAAATLSDAVDDLIKVTTDLLPADLACGVTLIRAGEPATFAAAGLSAEVIDEATHADGDGPGMDAVRTRNVVLGQCLDEESRWPGWTATARRHGLRGVLAYPFDVDPLTLGALTVYAAQCHAFVGDVPILAMLVADHASLLLRVRLRQLGLDEQLAQVSDLPGGDVTIERAVGIVMAQRGCPPQQALRHLHEAATHLGVGLPAVAERLVRSVADRGASV